MMELRVLEAEFKPKMHKALRFDGVDDRVGVPALNIDGSKYAVLLWIRPLSTANNTVLIISNDGSPRDDFWIRVNLYGALFGVYSSTWSIAGYHLSNAKYTDYDGKWTMIGVNFDGAINLIVNGKIDRVIDVSYVGGNVFTENLWAIGSETPQPPYAGLIGLILIYDIALSESEIKYLYHNPFDPPCIEHLVLWLTPAGIDTANGKWWDLSNKGNHGTIYGCNEVLLTEPEVAVV